MSTIDLATSHIERGLTRPEKCHPNIQCFQHRVAEERRIADHRICTAQLRRGVVKEISRSEAREIILEYEWLGTLGRAIACYGLFLEDILIGVANFGWPVGIEGL